MKTPAVVVGCLVVTAALLLLMGCPVGDPAVAETDSCTDCHSGDTAVGNAILAAQSQYENSGHFNGPRTFDPNETTTGHIYLFHGSNAMYTNGSSCSQCHTHQGFVEFVDTGTVPNLSAASQPGCFTCHKPHETEDFSLRKQTAEVLADGTSTFSYGKGNLCATCHKARTTPTAFLTGFPKTVSSSSGPHHGPQADMLMGVNNWVYGANTYNGESDHAAAAGLPDSCVSCHMYEPASRLSGTLQLGGHGMYLTGDVHGSEKDIVAVCSSCHTMGATFETSHTAPADWDGDGSAEDKLLEIQGLADKLVVYFGTAANFTGGAGPIVNLTDGGNVTSPDPGEWNGDWEFVTSVGTLTEVQAQSLWNLKFYVEDHSGGIHNPTFAAQILYDAIDNLNDNAAAGITLGGTRP